MLNTLLLVALIAAAPAKTRAPLSPQHLSAVFSEKAIELHWDSVPGVDGYNIYSSPTANTPIAGRRRINPNLVTSGTRFTYIWELEKGKHVRRVKGYEHHFSVTAVKRADSRLFESAPSAEMDDRYFEGFSKVLTRPDIERVLTDSQSTSPLPAQRRSVTREAFISFMIGPGARLMKLIADTLDFRETGGCAPVSTVLVNLMDRAGIFAYRIEGTFIKEYHTFVVVNIDGVEYVLDFTADQFIPGVSPVFFPRDFSFLNDRGKLDRKGTPVYAVAKIYTPEQSTLSDSPEAEVYRTILARAVREAGL